MLRVQPARFADALALAPSLRFADVREIAATWGIGAREGLMGCMLQSDRVFRVVDGQHDVVGLWGVTDVDYLGWKLGVPWLLGSAALFAERRELVARSALWVQNLLIDYDVLTNLTDADNVVHLRWLSWCGFRSLRRHERYGARGRPFEEFYLINEACRHDPRVLRDALLQRAPSPPDRPVQEPLAPLVAVAADCLGGAWQAGLMPRLLDAVAGIDRATRGGGDLPARLCRRAGSLIAEVAAALPERWAGSTTPAHELLHSLADLAELSGLGSGGCVEDLVTMPLPGGVAGTPHRSAETPSNRLEALARYCRTVVTASGRWRTVDGVRLRLAAAGARAGAGRISAGTAVRRLEDAFRGHFVRRALATGGRLRTSDLADDWRRLLRTPVDHGRVMAAMSAVGGSAGSLRRAVRSAVDGWAVSGSEVGCIGDAWSAAGRLADQVSATLFPEARLGLVVGGHQDRHAAFRLLRGALVDAACRSSPGAAVALLRHEVLTLLLAARFEREVLDDDAGCLWALRLRRAVDAVAELFGATLQIDDDGELFSLWLQPVLAAPVIHRLQLRTALAVWDVAERDALPAAIDGLGDVATGDVMGSRAPLRKFLRRVAAEPDTLKIHRYLGLQSDRDEEANERTGVAGAEERRHHRGPVAAAAAGGARPGGAAASAARA
jgi:hypothetical protein